MEDFRFCSWKKSVKSEIVSFKEPRFFLYFVDEADLCLTKGSTLTVYAHFLLRRGKFAVVKRCVEKATGKVFAAKFLRKRRRGRDCRAEVTHEMAVLEMARNNARVVNLHAAYETDHDIVLVLE